MPALELRPNCELCDRDLLPQSYDARICSNECTFCADCADHRLLNVCPNCGGELVRRPIRPLQEYRPGEGLRLNPPGMARRRTKYAMADIAALVARLKDVPAHER
ncbi:MAG TPA: DUF1272 domain-containing protein [Devosia sp.]|nr:DUF1272 domain-containing protein [Devosia sp.]